MSDYGIWKTVKIGFWLGIGFIIPQMIVMYGGTVISVLAMPSMLEMSMSGDIDSTDLFDMDTFLSEANNYDYIKIDRYEDKTTDGQLLVIGSLTNNGSKAVSSIQLEAELFDEAGEFVYECTEYINNRVHSGSSENFQIKCGCKDSNLPKYNSIKISVIGVHNY
ncbi:MAG: FxLYD domain-containing protein [Candidatus Thiodiazotropha taylori]